MHKITVTFTKQEATAVKFALAGARHTIHSEPHFVAPLGEAIVKLDAAIANPEPDCACSLKHDGPCQPARIEEPESEPAA